MEIENEGEIGEIQYFEENSEQQIIQRMHSRQGNFLSQTKYSQLSFLTFVKDGALEAKKVDNTIRLNKIKEDSTLKKRGRKPGSVNKNRSTAKKGEGIHIEVLESPSNVAQDQNPTDELRGSYNKLSHKDKLQIIDDYIVYKQNVQKLMENLYL